MKSRFDAPPKDATPELQNPLHLLPASNARALLPPKRRLLLQNLLRGCKMLKLKLQLLQT